MPGYLILDIDGSHYTLLTANTGRGGLVVQPPRGWDDDKPFQQSTAEAQGKAFKDKLSSFGVAPAPLVIAIGRDRLVLKEIKFPSVPAHEEPGIVRFQALKELTDAGDDVVIDYQPRSDVTGPDKKALVVALKRDVLRAAQTFAQAAGLKLAAVVPRAYGIMAALQSASPSSEAVAAITIGTQGGEFLVSRGDQLLFNRAIAGPALASDAALLSEVRRNLAVHNSQSPQSPVSAVYIAEGPAPAGAAAKLRETLAVPVHPLNPLATRRANETGIVRLTFLIDVDGKVLDSKIERTSGSRRLDEAARGGLSQCRFQAGHAQRQARAHMGRIEYVWKLE